MIANICIVLYTLCAKFKVMFTNSFSSPNNYVNWVPLLSLFPDEETEAQAG